MIRSRRGVSNLTEYVILVSVVAGAAITMQPFVRVRLQGAMRSGTASYEAAVAGAVGAAGTYEPVRNSNSQSVTRLNMGDADSGQVNVDSTSNVGQTK